MKRSSGLNAPVASNSRSHSERSDSCSDDSSFARVNNSVRVSAGAIRSTKRPPFGDVIRLEMILDTFDEYFWRDLSTNVNGLFGQARVGWLESASFLRSQRSFVILKCVA